MKRNPRKVKWTKAFRRAAGKEMTVDSTLEFEKRRNIPVRYDRDLMQTTLKAIKRVQEIKQKREKVHYKNRMAGKKERELQENIKALQKNIELVEGEEIKQKIMEHKFEKQERNDMELV
ncbi:ATPase-activating ribosome biosynthesis protein [Boothiomyces sp. JEL0866]|nr:ATPase-activating ribosome biosynthesis protein [Boothiomyces sp. JEL0866]